MKINNLKISGFLSYQEEVEIDFTQFSLACVTGSNGAGKSSLLDAITFSLFGRARQRDESLINLQSDTATVTLSFEYANENYTVCRSNQRGKAARLTLKTPELDLTERTVRDTQNKIESILKINYETFIHAVFFLQGESDQFVTASPGKRKQVLFDILGLAAWEDFRLNATAKIKGIEKKMEQSRGSVQVLEEDIRGEEALRQELQTASIGVENANGDIVGATLTLDAKQKEVDEFTSWKEGQEELRKSFTGAAERVRDLTSRRTLLLDQQAENKALTDRKEQIVKDYERHQEVAGLLASLDEKSAEWNKLNNELVVLEQQLKVAETELAKIPELEAKIEDGQKRLELAAELTEQIKILQTEQIKYSNEMGQLNGFLKEKEDQRAELEGHDSCPLCEQKLKDPQKLINKIFNEITVLETDIAVSGKKANQAVEKITEVQTQLNGHSEYGRQVSDNTLLIGQIQHRAARVDRARIETIGHLLLELDYDADKAVQLKQESTGLRNAPGDHGLLIGAEKIGDSLIVQIEGLDKDLDSAIEAQSEASTELELSKDKYTEGYEYEHRTLLETRSQKLENARLAYDLEVKKEGQIEAQLQNIEKQKVRLKEIKAGEKENTDLHQKYSVLQEAFSKKGVPALLVEQALPQIESKANQLLNRLSNGDMSVHFVTQKAYSDSSREDMQETLDVQIQDQAGIRDYELFSGGESFRINFAIRMALSNVLANRSGAKLRTLVIDEGFGSQDAGGRDRLINAINTVKAEYDKVLVITHVQEVIESFPVQLRIEKTNAGSQVRIL